MLLIADGFFGDFEHALQHDPVQLYDVEFPLPGGERCQRIMHGSFFGSHQIRTLPGYGDKRGPGFPRLAQERGSAAALRAQVDALDIEEAARAFEHALAVVGG